MSPNQLTARLNPWWSFRRGLRLGNVTLPRKMETEHILILGSQGSGKSSLIRSILQQVESRQQPCIVVDPECEFVAEFYKPERGDYVLNPLDQRAPFWSPWLEFRDEQKAMDVQAMVGSLIRNRARTQAEAYWQAEGRRLLETLFHQTTNLTTLRGLAAKDKGDGRESVINALQPLSLLPTREQCQTEWSALRWASKREGWLFLTSTEDSRQSVQALQGIWLDLLIRRLMSGDIDLTRQTFIVADEVATMGYQPQLEQSLVTRGRKRGLSVILSLQNIAQLDMIYGRNPTIVLAAQPGTIVLLKCGEPETAEWASRLLGEHEVEGERWPRKLVMASEIQTLRKFRGFVIGGPYRAPLKVKKKYFKPVHEQFIFRTELKPATKPLDDKSKDTLWRGVWQRCRAEKHISYKYYGGRGIELRFENKKEFFDHLGDPPAHLFKPSIERKDPDGHYERGNLTWIEYSEQQANKRYGRSTPPSAT